MTQAARVTSSIRAARTALGWSQTVLARQAGVSLVALARLEAGLANPRPATVQKLVAALEAAGIQLADNTPLGGYTLTAAEVAITESTRRTAVGGPSPARTESAI